MLQLGLNSKRRLHNNTLDIVPYLLSRPGCSSFTWFCRRLNHSPLQTLAQFQLVRYIIEIRVLLIETVIGQMAKDIAWILVCRVFFGSQSHKPIIIQKDGHGINDTRYQHVNPKVELVIIPERWLLNVFLHDEGLVFLDDFRCIILT
jgi:hypothetical protein